MPAFIWLKCGCKIPCSLEEYLRHKPGDINACETHGITVIQLLSKG